MPETKPHLFRRLLAPLASLKLTVVLISLAMLLIYAGTWAQIDLGIWQVQKAISTASSPGSPSRSSSRATGPCRAGSRCRAGI